MKEPFKELLEFWGGWFSDADLEGRSDPEVVRQYLETITASKRIKVIAQFDEILSQDPLPLELLAKHVWRVFDTQAEAREWLGMIKRELEAGSARYADLPCPVRKRSGASAADPKIVTHETRLLRRLCGRLEGSPSEIMQVAWCVIVYEGIDVPELLLQLHDISGAIRTAASGCLAEMHSTDGIGMVNYSILGGNYHPDLEIPRSFLEELVKDGS